MAFEVGTQQQQEGQVILLKDTHSGTTAEIFAFGGLLNAFNIAMPEGGFVNVVDGFSSVKNARENILNGFKSAKLSPFVCRMRKGSFRFQNQDLKVNKHYMGEHAIHGLVYDASFTIIDSGNDDSKAFVTLEHNYLGEDTGYPFAYRLRIHWQLEAGNKLTVTTHAQHQNSSPIPFADGWHPYFTLGGKADEWSLQFNSRLQLEYDGDLLPTGKLFTDTRFENGSLLKGIELDNSFELSGNGSYCTLQNDRLKLQIIPDQNYPILQLYIPPHRNSIAIENLSGAPDNFNNNIHLVLLSPGEERVFTTSYSVEVKS